VVRPLRGGFTLVEMMMVIVIISGLTLFSLPKFHALEERSRLASARQELQAAIATARAAAIQKGRTAQVVIVGNALTVRVTIDNAGTTKTLLNRIQLDSVYKVTVTPSAPADSLLTFDMRGFLRPRLGATEIYHIVGASKRDSVCITTGGQIMPRSCSL
jgi:prepilin-type N-terminal cleavage/methylation domain-containing protein